jgi:amidophosphoribosyltransferase
MKLTLIKNVVKGKRVIVIDDSIVRGTTTKGKIHSILEAGAKEVHMRVGCPPIICPCFYGVDFPTKEELIAHGRTVEEIREFLHVKSLGYISMEGLLSCLSLPADHYCTACWSGKYPIPVNMILNKFMMERHQMQLFNTSEL